MAEIELFCNKIKNQPIRKRENSHFEISQSELRSLIKKKHLIGFQKTIFKIDQSESEKFQILRLVPKNPDFLPKNRKF